MFVVLGGALRRRRTFLYEIIIIFASDVPNSICVRHVGGGEIDASTDLNTVPVFQPPSLHLTYHRLTPLLTCSSQCQPRRVVRPRALHLARSLPEVPKPVIFCDRRMDALRRDDQRHLLHWWHPTAGGPLQHVHHGGGPRADRGRGLELGTAPNPVLGDRGLGRCRCGRERTEGLGAVLGADVLEVRVALCRGIAGP